MKFNYSLIQYALKQNLHVEYFIWSYLRDLNQNGFHDLNSLSHKKIHKSTVLRKSKDNIFFKVRNNKIILTGEKKLNIYLSRKEYIADFDSLSLFANKNAAISGSPIKGWNSTIIKYLLISIFASQYNFDRPYALSLIEEDTHISISTIQRALKVFAVEKTFIKQEKYSSRSYFYNNDIVSLSPNFYRMPLGKTRTLR
jgi:hypothetical protein